jgi:outer membrane protein assembly factor BamB
VNHFRAAFFVLIFLAVAATGARADNWPSWRGPNGDGISGEKGLPTTWSETKNVVWKLSLPGKGSSTPITWGERIFLTCVDGNDLVLVCVSTKGDITWKSKLAGGQRSTFRKDEGNEASASPSTDGKHIFTFVGSGDVACHDFEGKQLWHFNAQKRYGKFSIQHGIHVTPVLHEDRLFIALIHSNGHWVIALNKATGEELWKVERKSDAVGESREAYASPVLWQNGKELNLVVLGADYTTGHRLSDGAEIWRLGDLNPKGPKYSNALRIIATPVASSDQLYVPTARGGLMVALKQGAEGSIKTGNKFEAWRIPKGAPDVPSPLYHDGLVYLMRENGVLMVVDAKTGSSVGEVRLNSERYRASPVYGDGHVYLTSRESGTFTVVKASAKTEVVSTNRLSDEFTASPAIAQGRIYLRGFRALYAIGEK